MKKNILITLSAPSGSGKNAIINKLLELMSDTLTFAKSATTRPMREGESQGNPYYFLEIDEFKKRIRENGFIEYEEVYENGFYGVLKEEITRIWSENKNAISDVDVLGALNVKKILGKEMLSIFVLPPSAEELEKRLRNRGTESEASIKERLGKADFEMHKKDQFDFIVINDDLDAAVLEVKKIIEDYHDDSFNV